MKDNNTLSVAPDGGHDIHAALMVYPEQLLQLSLLDGPSAKECLKALAAWIIRGNYAEPTNDEAQMVFSVLAQKHEANVKAYRKRKSDASAAVKSRWSKRTDTAAIRPYNDGNATVLPRQCHGNTTTNYYNNNSNNVVVEDTNTTATAGKRVIPTLEDVLSKAKEKGISEDFARTFYDDMTKDDWVILKDGKTIEVTKLNLAKMLNGRWRRRQETTAKQDTPSLEALRAAAARIDAEKGEE